MWGYGLKDFLAIKNFDFPAINGRYPSVRSQKKDRYPSKSYPASVHPHQCGHRMKFARINNFDVENRVEKRKQSLDFNLAKKLHREFIPESTALIVID